MRRLWRSPGLRLPPGRSRSEVGLDSFWIYFLSMNHSFRFLDLIWCLPFYPSRFLLPVFDSVSQLWCAHIAAHFASRISPLDGHSVVKVHERTLSRSRHRESGFYSHFLKLFYFQRNVQFQATSHMHFDRRVKVLSLGRQRERPFWKHFLKIIYFQMVAQFWHRYAIHFAEWTLVFLPAPLCYKTMGKNETLFKIIFKKREQDSCCATKTTWGK